MGTEGAGESEREGTREVDVRGGKWKKTGRTRQERDCDRGRLYNRQAELEDDGGRRNKKKEERQIYIYMCVVSQEEEEKNNRNQRPEQQREEKG